MFVCYSAYTIQSIAIQTSTYNIYLYIYYM